MVVNMVITFLLYRMNGSVDLAVLTMVVLVWSVVQMPLILGLTVKSQHNKARPRPEIPRGLQYHEKEDENLGRSSSRKFSTLDCGTLQISQSSTC